MKTIGTMLAFVCLYCAGVAQGQDRARMTTSMTDKKILVRTTNDPTYIPAGSKV